MALCHRLDGNCNDASVPHLFTLIVTLRTNLAMGPLGLSEGSYLYQPILSGENEEIENWWSISVGGGYPNKGMRSPTGLRLISDTHDGLPTGLKMACDG